MSDEERRSENKDYGERISSMETQVKNQGVAIGDFISETRKNIDSLFSGMDRVVDKIGQSQSTNWSQVGVMFSLAGMVGAFLYIAFIQPLQETQKNVIHILEKNSDDALWVERDLIDKIHKNELNLVKLRFQGRYRDESQKDPQY